MKESLKSFQHSCHSNEYNRMFLLYLSLTSSKNNNNHILYMSDASKLKTESSLSKLVKGRARQLVGYTNFRRSHMDFIIRKTS